MTPRKMSLIQGLSLCLKYKKLQEENKKLKQENEELKKNDSNKYEFLLRANINGQERNIPLYKVSGLLKLYGYFKDGFPDLSEKTMNDRGDILLSKSPIHLKRIFLYKSLAKKLSISYRKHNKKNNPIGTAMGHSNTYITSRSNSYPDTPYIEQIVCEFMEENPECLWLDPTLLIEEDLEKKEKKKKEKKERKKNIVKKCLKGKKYLRDRIQNGNLTLEEEIIFKKKYDKIITRCKNDSLRKKEMEDLFRNFRKELKQAMDKNKLRQKSK